MNKLLFFILLFSFAEVLGQNNRSRLNYEHSQRERYYNFLLLKAKQDYDVKPLTIPAFETAKPIIKKGEHLFSKCKKYSSKAESSSDEFSVREMLESMSIEDFSGLKESDLEKRITHAIPFRLPILYVFDENIDQLNEWNENYSSFAELKSNLVGCAYIFHILIDEWTCLRILCDKEGSYVSCDFPHYKHIENSSSIKDVVLINYDIYSPSLDALVGCPQNSFFLMRRNQSFNSYLENASSFQFDFGDFKGIRSSDSIKALKREFIYKYDSTILVQNESNFSFYSNSSKIYAPYFAWKKRQELLTKYHDGFFIDTKVLPGGFFEKIGKVLNRKRYQELVENQEKLILWFHMNSSQGFPNSVLLGIEENSILTISEIENLLEVFTYWSPHDFWDKKADEINKLIIDFSKFPDPYQLK